MASIAVKSAFENLVGNTRLVRLRHASEITGCNIFGKCEYENPGQSIKDRAALWMILGKIQIPYLPQVLKRVCRCGTSRNP